MISNETLLDVIRKTNGKFFKVLFVKKDGSLREMTCRLGVKKDLRGGKSTTEHLDNIVTVYDVFAKGYRNINLDTVKYFKCGSVVLNVGTLENVGVVSWLIKFSYSLHS